MLLFMAFFSACEVLASEGAQNAIANGREIRQFEDQELAPLERVMEDLFTNEIQPHEVALEDLRHELRTLQEDLRNPMRDSEIDILGSGGVISETQLAFDGRYRELEDKFLDALEQSSAALGEPEIEVPTTAAADVLPEINEGDESPVEANN